MRVDVMARAGVSRMAAGTATASCSMDAQRIRCAAVMSAIF